MTTKQPWFHGRVTGLSPAGDPVSHEVPFSSMSQQWIRNHLAEKATQLMKVYGFRSERRDDPNTIILLHPTKDCMSFVLTCEECPKQDADCEGGCDKEETSAA